MSKWLLIWLPFLLLAVAAFIGFVKFMAWWRVAFGSCMP